jgi:CBS domain-containing protein
MGMSEPSAVGATPVSTLISDTVARIPPDATLVEVARALTDGDIGALVVGTADEVVGIVSERDLVRGLAGARDPSTTRAGDVASTELLWCDATATVAEVAERMMEHYVRHVLLEEDGRLVGIVSARDLLGAYAAADMDLE